MPKQQYRLKDPNNLNLEFYNGLDEGFIYRKVRVLNAISENTEAFAKLLAEIGEESITADDKLVEGLRAEIHLAEFHQFEAFFALLLAAFQPDPHWLYLTEYAPGEIRKKAQLYLDRQIGQLTNDRADTIHEFLEWSIYCGIQVPSGHNGAGEWKDNLNNIDWLIRRIATRYVEAAKPRGKFNAYKHGLRARTGESYLRFRPTDSVGTGMQWTSKDSLIFLELEKIDEDTIDVYKTIDQFSVEESLCYLDYMYEMLKTLRSTRLSRCKEENEAQITAFYQLDKDEIMHLQRDKVHFKLGILQVKGKRAK